MNGRWARLVAGIASAVVVAIALGLTILALDRYLHVHAIQDAHEIVDPALFPWQLLGVAPFALVGAVVATKRPTNSIGWLLLATSFLLATYVASRATLAWDAMDPGADLTGPSMLVVSTIAFYAMSVVVAPRLLLVFPTGRLVSPTWRLVTVAQIGVAGILLIVVLTPGDLSSGSGVPNPFGIDALGGIGAPAFAALDQAANLLIVLAGTSLVVRYRRAEAIERSQLKWIAWAGALAIASLIGHAVLSPIAPWTDVVTYAVGGVAASLVPVAIGIAVLRYRLFDIDRIVSRSIAYLIITAVLFGVFFGMNVVLQSALGGVVGESPLVVAASTLVVAALFQPVRLRVQRAVDRRFHRARYDAERTVAGFAGRLRDQLDLPTLASELRRATSDAVEPTTTSVWLRLGGHR